MATECCFETKVYSKESFIKDIRKKEWKSTLTVCIGVTLEMVRGKAQEHSNGTTERYMMVFGKRA